MLNSNFTLHKSLHKKGPKSGFVCGCREGGPFEFLPLKLDLGSCKDEMGAGWGGWKEVSQNSKE